jgi:NSS family neurotransmitter:Na+ symporter
MATGRESIHGQWSSRWAFVIAATGSAVGLGNIWRFPYLTGENGGGAFVLIYLACVAVVGIPTLMAETMLGRRGRRSPINTMRFLAADESRHRAWQLVGWMGMLAGFLILSFYSVVAGWTLAYIVESASGTLHGASPEQASAAFDALIASPGRLFIWHSIFMLMSIYVVSQGVQNGLERAVKWLMPALFVLLLVMVGYAMGNGAFAQAIEYLFAPNFSALTPAGVLGAIGQAFFSLSLGMGAIMIYGSYLPSDASIPKTTIIIAIADTAVALLAGMAIFPIVFAFGLEPQGGPGLIFKSLPIAFGQMPGGQIVSTLFFVLLMVAAWTSAISLLEPVTAWLVENVGLKRRNAAWICGLIAWVLGIGALLSLNVWENYQLFNLNFFGLMEFVSSNVLLPLGGLLIAIFAGWFLSRNSSVDEMGMSDSLGYRSWRFLVRYVTPVGIALVFLNALGVLNL